MGSSWWVDGDELNERPRSGGAVAIEGFEFQKAYALLRLVWLPTCRDGLVEVRYEGAQDIDLRHGDGRQQFVQAKSQGDGGLSLNGLYDVVAGFGRDIISARCRKCSDEELPSFRLISNGAPTEPDAFELYRKVFLPDKHVPLIAALIKTPYRRGFSDAEVEKAVKDAITRTTFEIVLRDRPIENFREQASWALAEFGVPVLKVPASLARIESLLRPRASLQLNDVVDAIEELPLGHPGNASSPCRLLPAQRHLTAGHPLLKSQFLSGSPQSLWSAVANNLAIARADEATIEKQLSELTAHGGMLVLEAPGGAGKSTLARRIAWSAHRRGTHVVLDVPFPADVKEFEWAAIVSLCRSIERPLLLVVDDIWRHESFVEGLDRNVRSGLCILATSRPGERPTNAPIRLITEHKPLSAIGTDELDALALLLDLPGKTLADFLEVSSKRLAEQGQIFALSLVLQNGSLEQFATELVKPLRANPDHLNQFIDLCAAGMHDQTVPTAILLRQNVKAEPFWADKSYEGLVLEQKFGLTSRLRVVHALVASEVLRVCKVEPVARALALCSSCSSEIAEERRFAIRLLSNCVNDADLFPRCQVLATEFISQLRRFEEQASYADLHQIAEVLLRLDARNDAKHFLSLAKTDRISDARDVYQALNRANWDTFQTVFNQIIAFYEGNPTADGRRRFLLATRHFGRTGQKILVANQTASWLRLHNFPSEESRILFDIGAYVSDDLALLIAPLVNEYAVAPEIRVGTTLAALRLLKRARRQEYFPPLEKRLIEELAISTSWSLEEMQIARHLARLAVRWSEPGAKSALCEILMAMAIDAKDGRVQALMLQAALTTASANHAHRLYEAVKTLATQEHSPGIKNLTEHFNRKFGTAKSSST